MTTNTLTVCERHPDEQASLKCGGCGKAICTICMTLTGEGPRCPDCMARLNGQPVVAANSSPTVTTNDTVFCARHPQTETGLRCGRCNTPICPKCMVHGAVGIRCPDCAANPQRTVGVQVDQAVAKAQGKTLPTNSVKENYWYKNRAYAKVLPQHYGLAVLGSFVAAIVVGIVWGLLTNANSLLDQFNREIIIEGLPKIDRLNPEIWGLLVNFALHSSIHLIPEIALGFLVSETILRLTQNRVGPGLQIISGVAFALGIFTSIATISARVYQILNGSFPPIDKLLGQTVVIIGQEFSTFDTGILIFWAIGLAFAVLRLKR